MVMSLQLQKLAEQFQNEYAAAKEANLKRYQEAIKMYDEMIEQYKPGGGFGAGFEAQLEGVKKRDTGTALQHQISSGLFGVQSTGGISSRWEAEVGSPARLQLEDMRMGRYGEALMNKAGAVERREDEYPDSSLIANLYMQAAQVGSLGSVSGRSSRSPSSSGMPYPTKSTAVSATPARSSSMSNADAYSAYLAKNAGLFSQPSSVPSTPPAPAGTQYNPGGTTGWSKTPTASEQAQVEARLKKMYPQMYKPGWGKSAPNKTMPGNVGNWSPYL